MNVWSLKFIKSCILFIEYNLSFVRKILYKILKFEFYNDLDIIETLITVANEWNKFTCSLCSNDRGSTSGYNV